MSPALWTDDAPHLTSLTSDLATTLVPNLKMENSTFAHTPLEDAATDIRLLRYLDHATDGSLIFELGNYMLPESRQDPVSHPPYVPISYTWGSAEKTHSISVHGRCLAIGANSHYALSQAVAARERSISPQYYWMDQICI